MKVKNPTTGNWDKITLGGVTIDNSLSGDSTTHGASVHAVNTGLAGKISGDGSVEKIVRSDTAPTGTEATIWIEPSDFNSAEATILKDTLEDEDLDKAPTVHAVKQAIDNVENVNYDSLPIRSKIEYTKENSWDQAPAGYTESTIPYTLEGVGEMVDGLSDMNVYPELGKEKIIGIWYNGKPIYKYIILTTKSQANTILTNLKVEQLISTVGSYARANYNNCWPIPNYYVSETGYDIGLMGGSTPGQQVQFTFGNYYNDNNNVLLCIEYTKTTDKARSVTIREEAGSSSGGAN